MGGPPRCRWTPEGGFVPPASRGGVVPNGIGSRSIWPGCSRGPLWARTTESGRGWCGVIIRNLRKLSEPPGGRSGPLVASGVGLASLEARCGTVPDGIRAVPDKIGSRPIFPARGPCPQGHAQWNRAATYAGASSEFYESSLSLRVATSGLRRLARPLWRPWAARCPMKLERCLTE